MSRDTKSKVVSGEKGSPPQDESGSEKMEIADYFRMLNSRLDEQDKISKESNSRFEALQEDLRNTNQRLEELELRVPRPRLADVAIQEGKSGELEGIATEAGERRITPPEAQRQQPLLPSQPPRLPPQPPMMPQNRCLNHLLRHRSLHRCNTTNRRSVSLGIYPHHHFRLVDSNFTPHLP